jgi:hypothetical protein
MSNALSEDKKQQIIALGKLGWPLRRIEQATGVRRETASAYLKAAGVVVRLPRFWGKRIPAKPAKEVTPDFHQQREDAALWRALSAGGQQHEDYKAQEVLCQQRKAHSASWPIGGSQSREEDLPLMAMPAM